MSRRIVATGQRRKESRGAFESQGAATRRAKERQVQNEPEDGRVLSPTSPILTTVISVDYGFSECGTMKWSPSR